MALSVRDILQLDGLKGLSLISGETGLDHIVSYAGIADIEFDESLSLNREELFVKDSFVVSSLLFAKEDHSAIYNAVQTMYEAGTAAFAYKDVICPVLPQEVLAFSNEKGYPIIRFSDDVYLEDVIFQIISAVQEDDREVLSEEVIQNMIYARTGMSGVVEVTDSLSLRFRSNLRIAYITGCDNSPLDFQRISRSLKMQKE